MSDKKARDPALAVRAARAVVRSTEDGLAVDLVVTADGKLAARQLVRYLDEPVSVTEASENPGRGPWSGAAKVARVSVSSGGRNPKKPVAARATLAGSPGLKNFVGGHLLLEKIQRDLVEPAEEEAK